MSVQNIVSFSGGKDSSALVLKSLEKGLPIHALHHFDGGWEFPQMQDHLDKFENYTGIPILRIKPKENFEYWMLERPVIARTGPLKGQLRGVGHGWPSWTRRWCTRQKAVYLDKAVADLSNPVKLIGFAADEEHRARRGMNKKGRYAKYVARYPLMEWGVTESDALAICKRHGFDWGGLYDIFPRVSCFCCPLQSVGELKKLRLYFPDLWARMLKWDSARGKHNKGFLHYRTVHDLECRFSWEDYQLSLLSLISRRKVA
ncbi:MAG: phosphoadenosine phosphosulfate reductase family protein [Desulfovibrio sp.]|uniref:phosphoadenosine phosphosulfate reductase domain-containing protein n=1 Tax=Desulfovibrio sp. 7SRBS1 TaxID=3378064 RepID=UPI003B400790